MTSDQLLFIIPPRARIVVEFGGEISKELTTVQSKAESFIEELPIDCIFYQVDCFFYHDDFFKQPIDRLEKIFAEHVKYLRDDGQFAIPIQSPDNPKNLNEIVEILRKLNLNVYQSDDRIYATKMPHRRVLFQYKLSQVFTGRPRVLEPLQFLKTIPNFSVVEDLTKIEFNPDDCRINILERRRSLNLGEAEKMYRTLLDLPQINISEFDDWFGFEPWKQGFADTKMIDFRAVHAISTSTDELQTRFEKINPEVKFFRNSLMKLLPMKNLNEHAKTEDVTIFFGAVNRWGPTHILMPIINEFAKKYNVRFEIVSEQRFFDALETDRKILHIDKTKKSGVVPYVRFLLTMLKSDIVLMPMLDSEFNRCKSDIKFLEATSQGCAVIASPTVYERTIVDGKTGFIYRNLDEFKTKLEILITNAQKRHELVRAAYEYVKNERMLADNYLPRFNWYWDLWSRRDELTRLANERFESL